MPRLFAGLEIPPEIADQLSDLAQPMPGTSWVADDDFHVTLRFFGDVDGGTAREIANGLSEIDLDAFEVRLDGLDVFGGREPRSLWARVTPSGPIDALARAIERVARGCGLQPETRSFRPHVTIARLRGCTPDAVARYLGRQGAFRSEPFMVNRFVLYSAKPQVGGGPYVAEEIYRLAGGVWDEDDDPTVWRGDS